MSVLSPRCGRVMRRYETPGSAPVLEDPRCGRPAGHNGPCRSVAALGRESVAKTAYLRGVRQIRGRQYGRPGSDEKRQAA
jgi:hypothetical protein